MHLSTSELPYVTADIPGIGGQFRSTDDDFVVDEIPAYLPSGSGEHVFAWIEKQGLTTPAAAEHLAGALGLSAHDVGWAGMKDRHAVTRQWLSFPPPCTPEALLALRLPGISVLSAVRHGHKLRTGHLRGNRFTIRIRQVDTDADTAAERALAVLTRLRQPPGSPNWFGAQRFGLQGDNAELGKALITGTGTGKGSRRRLGGRERRLYISAFQSQLFNEYLRRRLVDGLLGRVLAGDLLQKRDSGGIFYSDNPAVDQERLDAGEVVPTGPMYGHRLRCPPAGSPAAEREADVLASAGMALEDFARAGKLAQGTRRALAVDLGQVAVRPLGDQAERAIELSFDLPAGSYATAVLREIVKGSNPFPG